MSTALLVLPESCLFLTTIFIVLQEALGLLKGARASFYTALFGLFPALFISALLAPRVAEYVFTGTMLIDPITQYIKAILIFTAIVATVCAHSSEEIKERERADFIALTLMATLGGCVAVSSMNLLTLFLALELSALATCFLIVFVGGGALASDAAVRQMIFNAAVAVLMAVGIILVFGFCKTMDLKDIAVVLSTGPLPGPYFILAMGLITVSLVFRMSLFPFHALAPGVIAGAPTPSAIVHGVMSGLIGFGVMLRILFLVFSVKTESMPWEGLPGLDWKQVLAVMAALTMTLTSFMAIREQNIKKLLCFSIITNMAFIACGLSVRGTDGIVSSLFAAAIYTPALLGAFMIVMICMDARKDKSIDCIRGLVWTNPFAGVALSIFLLSLAAIPGTVGFLGRFYILSALLAQGNSWLVIVGILNTVIAATYYFKLLSRIYEQGEVALQPLPLPRFAGDVQGVIVMLLLPTVLLGIYWDGLVQYISNSLLKILW